MVLRTLRVLRTDRIAPSPAPPSGREGRPSAKARRAALKLPKRDAKGVRPARPAGGERSGEGATSERIKEPYAASRVWLFDLDNTLHDASHASFPQMHVAIGDYVVRHVGVTVDEANAMRQTYWRRYGATLLGLVRHHGVRAAHFLEETHRMPGMEDRLRTSAHDRAALARLPGRKIILTNAPRDYALRVLHTLGLARHFEAVITIEDMAMFGSLRPKPDARMLRRIVARLRVPASRCVLVEDTLVNVKSARAVGMRGVWMQRYVDGRFRGHFGSGVNAGARPLHNARRKCPKPAYLYAKIGALRSLHRLPR